MTPHRIAVAVLVCGTLAGACTSLRRVQPVEFFRKNSPDVVWVTYPNNTIIPVAEPEITGDTLKGRHQGSQRRLAIPLGDVKSVAARQPDKTKTVLFLTALGGVWVSTVYFLWVSKAGPHPEGVFCGVYDGARDGPSGAPRPYC
jgi:hypothetical protein